MDRRSPRRAPTLPLLRGAARIAVLAAAGVLVVACSDAESPTAPSAPDQSRPGWGPPGPVQQMAFATNRDGNWEIYRINADGTGLVNLTQHASSDGPNGSGGTRSHGRQTAA